MHIKREPRIAIVHDWILGLRGGERVLHELARMYPEADLHSLIHLPGKSTDTIDTLRRKSSFLSSLPGIGRYYRWLVLAYPFVARARRLKDYDLVISISHSYAKGVVVAPGTPHICYCLTPIRYVSGLEKSYLPSRFLRVLGSPIIGALRWWDRWSSAEKRVTAVIAISQHIARRVATRWHRDASVIYPGVDIVKFGQFTRRPGDYYLLVAGFVPYKAEHLAIEAAVSLGRKLIVAGDGPRRAKLEARFREKVTFVGRVPDEQLARYYANCRALLYPQEEDFGMIAVEAQAAGAPVIAFASGGAAETVVPLAGASGGATGVLFERQTVDGMVAAIRLFEMNEDRFDPNSAKSNATRFSLERFRDRFSNAVVEIAGVQFRHRI